MLLSGCATQSTTAPTKPPSAPLSASENAALWERRVAQLTAVEAWQVTGKVGYRVPGDAGSASLRWSQESDESQLRLSGPLGAGSTRISSVGALLRVERDGVERLYSADAAPWLPGGKLLPVPVRSISYWLRGLPDPAMPSDVLEIDAGLAQRIVQQDWDVTISQYQDLQGLALPARIELSAPQAELVLRIILREWSLP